MKQISGETIKKQADEWRSWYEANNTRGRDAILFGLGEQWDAQQITTRSASNKETLTFNLAQKHRKRAIAQLKETEFSLNIAPANENAQDNVQESNAFRKILHSIMLDNELISRLSKAGEKCMDFGYSFIEVNFEREGNDTLNSVPVIRMHSDPCIAFWDKNASHPSRIDGRFVGIKKKCTKEQILEKFGKLSKKISFLIHEEDNEVIYYWFRDYRPCKFKLLTTGEYKREDKIDICEDQLETEEGVSLIFESLCEEEKLAQGNKASKLEKTEDICCIYFQIFINEKKAIEPKLFPTDDLPVPYHHGLTEWNGNNGMQTVPFIDVFKDMQKLHNYIQSQIATIAKNSSADKWFFNDDHILTDTQIAEAKNINTLEGGFHFGGSNDTIRRERAAELPMSMIQASQITKQELDEIGGSMMDAQEANATIVSGKAMDRFTRNIGLLNLMFLANHIEFVNTVGHLIRQMIPRLITEERTIISKNKDGSGEAIVVNQELGTGEIRNNIKDINNNFVYEMVAVPDDAMKKENTRKDLLSIIQVDPTLLKVFGDLIARNMDSPDSGEIERRFSAVMDQNLIKYSRGEMSLNDFQQAAQAQQKQQMQSQMALSQNDPQVQAASKMAQSEHEKAQAQQYKAETDRMTGMEAEKTKRMTAVSNAQKNNADIQVKIAQIQQQGVSAANNQQLELLEKRLKANQQIIDNREIDIATEKTNRNPNQ